MSEVKGATGLAPQWAPAKGLMEYTRMPGHAPGQIVLLHKPTASLLAADTITNLRGGVLHKTAPQLGFAPPGSVPSCITHAGVLLRVSSPCQHVIGPSSIAQILTHGMPSGTGRFLSATRLLPPQVEPNHAFAILALMLCLTQVTMYGTCANAAAAAAGGKALFAAKVTSDLFT